MTDVLTARPAHVPEDLVVDFDFRNPSTMKTGDDVYEAWARLYDGPEIFWTPRYGGHWVLTRAEDVKAVQNDYARFSHRDIHVPQGGRNMRLPPLEIDPPGHAAYRTAINPVFNAKVVNEIEESVRALAIETIEKLKPRGKCEFTTEFARVMPTTVFLKMMDLPLDQREQFVGWVEESMAAATLEDKRKIFAKISKHMSTVIADREVNRGTDIVSHLLNIRDEGKRLQHPDDLIGMVSLLFLGGLDTVANMLSFTTRFLAKNPEHRRRLAAEPDIIPQAAEEFIRRHGLSNTVRTVTEDTVFKGVVFMKNDPVMVPIGMSSMDKAKYGPNAMDIDFDRGVDPHAHDTFGNGPHRCPGATLARAEMKIFLQEWLARIPEFEIDPEIGDETQSGPVSSVTRLPLVW